MRTSRKEVELKLYGLGKKMFFNKSTLEKMIPQGTTGELQFLLEMLYEEDETRTCNRRARYQRIAEFPTPKTFEGYDFSEINFPRNMSQEKLVSLDFIEKKEVILFYGVCGSGKTHAMTALGLMACNTDYKVKFYTVSQLVMLLKKAKKEETLEKLYLLLSKQNLLCIDELGYVPMDLEGGQLLFQVISRAYETQAVMITTNLPFNAWGPLFADEQLAAAIIDRIVHHGHMIKTGSNDWRLKHSTMLDEEY